MLLIYAIRSSYVFLNSLYNSKYTSSRFFLLVILSESDFKPFTSFIFKFNFISAFFKYSFTFVCISNSPASPTASASAVKIPSKCSDFSLYVLRVFSIFSSNILISFIFSSFGLFFCIYDLYFSKLILISTKYSFLFAPPFFIVFCGKSFLAIIFSLSFNLAAKFSYCSNKSNINFLIGFSSIFNEFFCSLIIFFSGSNNSLCCLINSSYSFLKLLYNNIISSGILSGTSVLLKFKFFNLYSNGLIYKSYNRIYNNNNLSVFLILFDVLLLDKFIVLLLFFFISYNISGYFSVDLSASPIPPFFKSIFFASFCFLT